MLVVFIFWEDDDLTVSLITPVPTVREVVADQLGVHTGPVITAELPGLADVQPEVETPVGLAWVQCSPFSLVEG